MANDNKNDLPQFLSAALKVLAGIAGTTAALGGLATFVGLQYQHAYYQKLGIPISVLSFSTQNYVAAMHSAAELAVLVLAGVVLGIVLGVTWPPERQRKEQTRPLRNLLNRTFLVWFVALILAAGTSAWVIWASHTPTRSSQHYYYGLMTSYYLTPLIVGLASAYGIASYWEANRHAKSTHPDGKWQGQLSLVTGVILAALLGYLLILAPGAIANAQAFRDMHNREEFKLGTFITKGANNIPSEKPWPPPSNPTDCSEYVDIGGNSQPTPSLCQAQAVVVIHNNGTYFVSDACDFQTTEHQVYRIEDARVVRVAFQSGWANRVPVICPTYTPTFTPTSTPTRTPTPTLTPSSTPLTSPPAQTTTPSR
jgi:hypothetical protein